MPQSQKRKSVRHRVPPGQQSCEWKVEANQVSGKLLDESDGGFCVLIPDLLGVGICERAQLRTTDGWVWVTVIHIAEVQSGHASSEADSPRTSYRVGVQHLQKVIPGEEPCEGFSVATSHSLWRAVVVAVGVVTLAGALGLSVVLSRLQQ